MNRAVFLDRDGVLIEDVHLLTKPEQIRILPEVQRALRMLHDGGFLLIVVSNQPVIARGLATEEEVHAINCQIEKLLTGNSNPVLDGFYVCPHHPSATLSLYRKVCDCRKPRPGLILTASRDHKIDLKQSFVVGDRITDIIAGAKAGSCTLLVHTGRHLEAPIETSEPIDESIRPDHVCADLLAAAEWILKTK